MTFTIGIDIGGTRIKAAVMDDSGNLIEKIMESSSAGKNYLTLLTQLELIVKRLTDKAIKPVSAVGLAVAGLMDKKRKLIIESPNCPDMKNRYLADDLSKRIMLPTIMDNDANLMAIGEGAYGAARGFKHFIAITLGTGVGGAVISNSTLIRGVDGGGGELGHVPISIDGPECTCGTVGCLEAYIGHDGIHRFISENIPQYRDIHLSEINKLASEGDQDAIKVFQYIGKMLAVGLGGMVNTFNPELLVVGGGVAIAGELLFQPLREELHKRAFKQYLASCQVKEAQLGNWAGVVGAAKVALDLV